MTALAAAGTDCTVRMTAATSDLDDRSLIERIADARDAGAFERLYHDYRRRLGPFMYRIVRDPAANEEVFNDVMLTVWRKAETYNGQSKVSTWIFAIAYRQCLKVLRGRPDTVGIDEAPEESVDERGTTERRDLVGQAIAQLSPEHRLVIELSYFQGNTYSEIAAIADCPENTVKTRIFYARRRLKEIMAALGERPAVED
ncbi:MAG: sigma-70 family RNA polymerase sigma factor [Woeseiaceae bacterium]|nr:sigma-70 family RNA polymerase sigma factor [Woeseiaceae bacterium]